jgi:hypothetical protein
MAAVKPLKIETGKRKRFAAGDFLAFVHGGTGLVACAVGDLLLGSGVNTVAVLNIGTVGKVLTSNGTTASWETPAVSANPNQQAVTAANILIAGNPVYASAADTVDLAKADSATTSTVVGLAIAGYAAGAAVIQTTGTVTLTTGEWDAVAGTTGGLVFNTKYYLSAATAGLLTATAPDATGNELSLVGTAISTVDLVLSSEMQNPITL